MRGIFWGWGAGAAGGSRHIGAGDAQTLRGMGDLWPGEQKSVNTGLAGKLQFAGHGIRIVKEDEVDAAVRAAVGKIAGAQLPGEEDGGADAGAKLLQRFGGKGNSAAGEGGEQEILGGLFHGQHHPVRAEAPADLLKALGQAAAGDGGGDHYLGVGGQRGVIFRHKEGHTLAGQKAVQPLDQPGEGGEPPVKVQQDPR